MRAAKAAMLMRRRGFSLIELTVVLVIVGVLGGSVGVLLMRQQRFYRGTSELIATRQSVRDALEVLATDLRGMSVADTVRLLADSAVEFFSTIGSTIVCQSLDPYQVGLAPAADRPTLGSFATQPDTGDFALFYFDSGAPESRWRRYRITAFSARSLATTCPASSGIARDVDIGNGAKTFALSLSDPLPADVHPGSPVLFERRGRYSLYRASDGEWYLGYRRCNVIGTSNCGSVQPLSGPYRQYSLEIGESGLAFEYFDRAGAKVLDSPLSLARIDVSARASSRRSVMIEGRGWLPSDSAHVSIAIRNRL